MSHIAIELFGAPTAYVDGLPVYIRRRKALALLVYLATSQRMHGRDELAALFWPEQAQQAARGNLRRAIFSLHRLLGSTAPHLDGDRVDLLVGLDIAVDVVEFRVLVKQARRGSGLVASAAAEMIDNLEHAVALYQDDFARSLSLADCSEFEEWLRAQAESLRADLLWALTALVAGYDQLDEIDQAISHARRLLLLDPYSDEALQRLMRLNALAGQVGAAIHLYERHTKLLAQDLDLPPGPGSQQLYERLRAGAIPVRPGHPEKSTAQPAAQPDREALVRSSAGALSSRVASGESTPFVAREFAMATLRHAFDAAHSGHGQVIFVAGEAGSGKTTLIEEFTRRIRRQHPDLIVATGACTTFAGAGEPLQPFVEILHRLTGVSTLDDPGKDAVEDRARQAQNAAMCLQAVANYGANLVGRVIPHAAVAAQRARQPGRLEGAEITEQSYVESASGANTIPIHEELTAVLQHIASQRMLLLMLDDLQWSDPSTAAFLYHLARRISSCPILIVGAYRPEEVSWNATQPHSLGEVLEELQQRYGPIQISLDVQGEAEARHFVDALLDSEPNRLDEAFRRDLFHHSRGHALFTVELVRQMKETRQLSRHPDGYWVQDGPVDWSVLPAKVEASIARRFHRLSPALYRMLAAASVEGELFSADVLAQVLGTDIGAVITQLGLLVQAEHGLVAGMGIERTGALRLARYRFRHNLFQQYLYHRLDATERQHLHEQVGRAIESLYQADTDALSGVAAVLANHFDQAEAIDAASRYHLLAGQRAVRMSAYAEAREHLARGLSQVRSMPANQQSVECELELVLELCAPVSALRGYGHPELNALYTEAFQLAAQIKDQQKMFRTMHGVWRYRVLRAELREANEVTDRLLAIAEEQQQPALLLEAWRAKGISAFHLGDLAEAETWLFRCLTLYDPEQNAAHAHTFGHDPCVSATGYLAHIRWLNGEADTALRLADETIRLAEALNHPLSLAHALGFTVGSLYQYLRRPVEVLATVEQLATLASKHGYPMWEAAAEMLGGWALSVMGQTKIGIDRLRNGLDAWQSMGNMAAQPYYIGLLAEAYLLAGDRPHALVTVNHALDLVEQTSERWWEPELWRLRQELL
jgi:predicted ATPase/DNA-binding SARP family transcriptional activator